MSQQDGFQGNNPVRPATWRATELPLIFLPAVPASTSIYLCKQSRHDAAARMKSPVSFGILHRIQGTLKSSGNWNRYVAAREDAA